MSKVVVLFVGLFLLAFFTSALDTAAPSAPVNVINHTTKECGEISTGDECYLSGPADGWELLNGSCPEGYTVLDSWAPSSCTFSASPYCCETTGTVGEGCTSLPGYTSNILIGSVLVIIAIIGVVLIVRYLKRSGHKQ